MFAQGLKEFHNRTVLITFRDGEIATARLTCTEDDCENALVDILGSNCPHLYYEHNACSYTVPCSEIISVTAINDSALEPIQGIEAVA